MSKILISYFSATGTTKGVAEKMSEALGADLFEIVPATKYTEADLDWHNKFSRSSVEMNNQSSRPSIAKKIQNINDYDTIIIGFPVWWYVAPKIINTFIEENNLKGKNLYVFVTSGGSLEKQSYLNLEREYPNLTFKGAARFTGEETSSDYQNFIKYPK